LHERGDVLFFVGEDACFEVAFIGMFRAEAGSCEVGGCDEGAFAINDDGFGVDAGAESAFEEIAFDECWVAVEVFAEARTGFFGVDEADGDSVFDKFCEAGEKWDGAFSADDVHVFDVRGDDPDELTGGGDLFFDDAAVDRIVEDEFSHVSLAPVSEGFDEI